MSDPFDTRVIRSRIRPAEAGRTLIDHLVRRFTYRDRAAWLERLAAGELLLDGRPARAEDVLAADMVLEYRPTDIQEPAVDTAYRIVYEDEFLLVIDKPGDLPTHPSGIFYAHTLWHLLTKRFGAVHLVNRLDRETSGLLLAAKDPRTAARLARGVRHKTYLAFVFGTFSEALDAAGFLVPAGGTVRKKRAFVRALPPGVAGETAETRLRPVETANGLSLVEAELVTGRMHQIRATLCSLGYPLVGDKLYGPDETCYLRLRRGTLTEADKRKLLLPRQALHAWKLGFRHPETGETCEFTAPLPADLADLACKSGFSRLP